MQKNMIKNYSKKIKKLEDFNLEEFLKYYLKKKKILIRSGKKTRSRRKK